MKILALLLASWTAPQDEARVAARLKELESAEVKTVYRAVERLVELGTPALPALETHLRQAAPRVRPYLELAVQEIRAAAAHAEHPTPKRHSLQSTDKNAADLLIELKNKSGLPLSVESLLEEEKLAELSLDVREATTLEALDAVCKAGGLTFEHTFARFEIYPGGYADYPKFFFDHYLFRLENYARSRSVTFRKPLRDRLRIDMSILWDPAIAPSRLLPARLIEAVDDSGKSLIPPPDPTPKPEGPAALEETHPSVPEGSSTESFEILPPGPKASKIARLCGVIPVAYPKSRVEVTFEKPAPGHRKAAGGFEFTVKAMDREHCAVELRVTSKTLKPEELRAKPVLASIRLKGQESPRCVASAQEEEGGLRVRVEFENLDLRRTAGRFRAEEPRAGSEIQALKVALVTEVIERRVPFEFRDVTVR